MRITGFHRGSLPPLLVGVGGSLFWPAQAFVRALIRFIHGIPVPGTRVLP